MDNILLWILGATLVNGLVALVGAFTLLISKKTLKNLIFGLVAFSSGALISGAFFHMIAESLENFKPDFLFGLVIAGFSFFYLMERILKWHHCHEGKCDVHTFTYIILFGDEIDNFMNVMMVAATFLVIVPFGMLTTVMIIIHELPQELGDFGVLVYGGLKEKKALLWNLVSQLTCVLGALFVYFLPAVSQFKMHLLPLAAGGFIYIAASDLIPELHKEADTKKSILSFSLFLVGVAFLLSIKLVMG